MTTPTTGDIVAKIVAALRISEPNLDASIGTVLRNIFDAVGDQIAAAYTDGYLINYQYDIDSKAGGDLDDFCSLFGITRLPAQRATGVLTFSRPTDATTLQTLTTIPPGTQAIAMTNPIAYAQTTVSAVIAPGQSTVDVPVQAVVAGTAGNVAAGLLNTLASAVGGVTGCVNAQPLTGGTNQETDDQLRARFKATVFRSLAGTGAMYEAIAQSIAPDPTQPASFAVSQVNVIGSSKRWREQLQVLGGTATSMVTNAAYIFSDNVFCATDLDVGPFLTLGADFTLTPTNPTDGVTNATAVLHSLNLTTMPDGFYDLDFEYVPQASRNDPANTRFNSGGINNRVDVWCNGISGQDAIQNAIFSTAQVFSATPSSALYNAKFLMGSATTPTPPAGYFFVPLAYGPILSVPATITVGGTVYNYQSDYFIVHRNDCFGYTPTSQFGLAWTNAAGRQPPNNSVLTLDYTYNQVPSLVQDQIEQWRLVGTDTKAHAGKTVPLLFNFAVVFDLRFDSTAVTTNINTALATLLSTMGFDATLTIASALQTVANVAGVLNVRFLTSTDNPTQYAICRMSNFATNTIVSVFNSGGRATDVHFADDQYPTFFGTNIVTKAQNSFAQGA